VGRRERYEYLSIPLNGFLKTAGYLVEGVDIDTFNSIEWILEKPEYLEAYQKYFFQFH